MKLRTLVLIASAFLLSVNAMAQTRFLTSPEEMRRAAEGIVASVAAGNFAGALKELRPLSVISSTDFDVFEAQFNSQQANMLRQFGSPSGYEFLREDRLGTRLVRQQFFVFHEKAAMRWNFVFYKAEKGWVLSHFNFEASALAFFQSGG
jgi:hypothetical protein